MAKEGVRSVTTERSPLLIACPRRASGSRSPRASSFTATVTVGAALLTKSGKVYRGCNIENAAYGPSNCAERTAIFKAVSEGEREFAAIAVVGGKNGDASDIFPPCGVCRQVMQEFCAPDFMIYMGRSDGSYVAESLGAMLPYGFTAEKYMK